jgi:nucleotide-binding universal stress UspA family protein
MAEKEHFLVAVDHSPNSAPAAQAGAWLCRTLEAAATLAYVVEPPSTTLLEPVDDRLHLSQVEWGEERLRATAEEVFAGVQVDTKLIDSGQPVAEAICGVALATEASLVVMGTHGRSAIEQAIFGSTAGNVVRHAPCDVLTVRAGGPDGDVTTDDEPLRPWVAGDGPIRRILCGVDFSECSAQALRRAWALSERFGAELVVMHGMKMPFWPLQGESTGSLVEPFTKKAYEALAEQLEEIGAGDARLFVLEGEPGRQLLSLAAQVDADLVVMGTHGRTGLRRLAIGSVAERVVRAATIPVWCVRG